MFRLIVPIVIVVLMLFSGAVWALFNYLDIAPSIAPQDKPVASDSKTPGTKDALKSAEELAAELKGETKPDAAQGEASFDIARIDPAGTSVFAGRAAPGSEVTISGDGEKIGTAVADENGEWTYAAEHKFTSDDPKLALSVKTATQLAQEKATATKVSEAKPAEAKADAARVAGHVAEAKGGPDAKSDSGTQHSAKAVTSGLLKDLENMVEEARTAAPETKETVTARADAPAAPAPSPSVPEPSTATPSSAAPSSNVTAMRLGSGADAPARVERKTIPVPITFIFNEATFTPQGEKAAALLREYLKLKRFPKVSLTGHADERGTVELNMNLSRQRLETVSKFLREGGYDGSVELLPKGKSEPFMGVVRSEYGPEELFQLDRRVELIITR